MGVALRGDTLIEVELPVLVTETFLPRTAAEGYQLDAPLAAVALAEKISAPTLERTVRCVRLREKLAGTD
jgi:hypothetical protein